MKNSVFVTIVIVISAALGSGCRREAVFEKRFGDRIILRNCYRVIDRRSSAIEPAPYRQFLVVDGKSIEFANSHMEISNVFRGCSRVFVATLNNYGYFLMILEKDGTMTPLMRIGGVEQNLQAIECHQAGDELTLRLTIQGPVEGGKIVLMRHLRRSGAFRGL